MNILSIDQASLAGWCLDPSNGLHGTWDLKTRKDESSGMKMLRFKAKLVEVCTLYKVDLIVYERAAGMHTSSVIHSAKMIAIIESYAEESNIHYRSYSASEIKKFATGKGNAKKDAMIASCLEKYGIVAKDDNEADAIHMWYLAKSEI